MHDDVQLLRAYAETGSETAFRELVERRIGLVYGIALRRLGGDAHLAQEVAARVFRDLARKAPSLSRRAELSGWLFVSTRYASSDAVRAERRRRATLARAVSMADEFQGTSGKASGGGLDLVLDDALHQLGASDRQALLLRFYEGMSFAEVGLRLSVSENAARMRADRAIEKLRRILDRRGIASTAAAVAAAMPVYAQAAPAGMAAAVSQSALSGASALGGSLVAHLMSLSKLQVASGAAALALLSVGITGVTHEYRSNQVLAGQLQRLEASSADFASTAAANQTLRATLASLRASTVAGSATAGSAEAATKAPPRRPSRHFGSLSEALNAAPLFEESAVDVPPKAIDQLRPVYPPEARKNNLGGTVVVDAVVGADGDVFGAHAVRSDAPALTEAAVTAVSEWIFRPGLKAEQAVNTHIQVPIVFMLNNR